jgi:hypothetical protein
MKKALKVAVATVMLSAATAALATPSTDFWTPATSYVQPYLVPHLTYDSYFGERGQYPVDTGVTIGVLPWEKLQGEVGFDLFYPNKTKTALLLNAKLAVPEGALGEKAPGLSLGVQNIGFEKDVNDLFLVHATVAKTFGSLGNLAVGAYYGVNDKLLLSSSGAKNRAGAMVAYTSPDIVIDLPGLNKIVVVADAMTGKNALGAVGGGLSFNFTPSIDVITGPVFFLDKALQPGGSSMLWTVQLDVDFDLRKPAPAAPAAK